MRLIDADAFDERVRAAGGMSEEELSEDFKDGVQTVLYMMSKQPTITAQPEKRTEERTETHACDCVSRQAVQEIVDRIGGMYPYRQIGNRDSYSQYNEAWTDATNRVGAELNSLPSAQSTMGQVFDDDCVSRQAAISLPVKSKEDRFFQTQNLDDAYDYGWRDLQGCIEKLPPAQQGRETGAWIAVDYFADGKPAYREWKCSKCGCVVEDEKPTWNFCPMCGADMRSE